MGVPPEEVADPAPGEVVRTGIQFPRDVDNFYFKVVFNPGQG
jgi:hypothetical protein